MYIYYGDYGGLGTCTCDRQHIVCMVEVEESQTLILGSGRQVHPVARLFAYALHVHRRCQGQLQAAQRNTPNQTYTHDPVPLFPTGINECTMPR